MAEMLRASLRGNIQMRMDVAENVWPIEVDLAELEMALVNIAVNARDAMPQGGTFSITVNNAVSDGSLHDSDSVAISLHDSGVGIPQDILGKVFDPFFTTKEPGEGTGLGLSQVYGFAHQSGGTVQLDSQQGKGTTITIRLPRSTKPLASVLEDKRTAGQPQASGRVLLVEDNAQVADVTAQMLGEMGFTVEVVDRARKALDQLSTRAGSFDLLMTDVIMPDGMNGLSLATEARKRFPHLPIILISGYNNVVGSDGGTFPVLRKPAPYDELYRAVCSCLEKATA